ncbi:NUDIX hydrolase [Loktanella sp. S4079]|uniref:NUDIX hydrolase n=1 Tax=Loktanella sp. S4079 TaxID=579483 RepID=UPI0005FA31CD|nr:NUDIX hydrolase [Loktanella sp. S4079]KJZ19678.1 DNA mismatch repair protein MutT [Loktanella sp. S4079]
MTQIPIKDAATIIILRDPHDEPAVLMGQRGREASFMPGKFVFPGGAVDANDAMVAVSDLVPETSRQLDQESSIPPSALAAAAIRELWEETGQILGRPDQWPDAPRGWRGFAKTGHRPNGSALRFFFRAITPPGRPRRFDARFFLADATSLVSDPDDFGRAEDELSHLQWVPLGQARGFDLPFITQVVLAELNAQIRTGTSPQTVPFFRNDDEKRLVTRLGGRSPL